MFKHLILVLLAIFSLTLSSCTTGVSGLQSYIDAADGYQFLYPSGWLEVNSKSATKGLDIVFRDLIEQTENLSVIISEVPKDRALADLGGASEVGYRFLKQLNSDTSQNREVELINAESHETGSKTYYTLEYQVKLPNQERHNLASIAVSRGKLYTFNISTPESRWGKMKPLFETVANSFSVY
jgi:photosystem II oxygen-evolving enhancer protein 2